MGGGGGGAEQRREGCGHVSMHEGEAGVKLPPPPPFAATCQRVRVDPRDGNRTLCQCELDQALPPTQAALVRGEDVVLQCMLFFHRAPVFGAAVYKCLIGMFA